MKKNKNMDIIRAIAILMVLFYHVNAITGLYAKNPIVNTFLIYGGIVGVAIFLILSGYGIYNSLKRQKLSGEKFVYHKFIAKRFLRIAPQYYISLLILLLLTSNAAYLTKGHILTLVSHLFFFHNFFYKLSGAISGVCWTLALIFQFYLLAPFLFKILEKIPKLTLIGSFVMSIFLKFFVFHYLLAPTNNTNVVLYFNYGNQIFTSLNFFVLGMFIAKLNLEKKPINKYLNCMIFLCSLVGLYYVLRLITFNGIPFLKNTGIYSDCVMAYVWYSILAVVLGLLMYSFSIMKWKLRSIFSKILLFISKYEYGIYIWHLLIINNWTSNAPFIKHVMLIWPTGVFLIYFFASVLMGYLMTEIMDNCNWKSFFKFTRKKEKIYNEKILSGGGGLKYLLWYFFCLISN